MLWEGKMKSMKSSHNVNHPYIKDCLVYDIETDSLNPESATCKFVGFYSYKLEKYFIARPDQDWELIQKLISSHKVLIGWNNKNFDGPIMSNSINCFDLSYKIIFDGLQVLHNTKTRRPNRKPIIKLPDGRHLDAACKSNKLKDIGEVLGCNVVKGDIDYKIFQKNSWTAQEIKDIEHYLYADVALTREIFEYFLDYFDSFKELVPEEDIRKFNYIRSSTGSFAYSAISKAIGKAPIYPNGSRPPKEPFGGGYVLEPITDYAEDVIYFDFSSLYPHLEFQCNLFSPVTDGYTGKVWNGDGFFETFGIYKADEPGIIEQKLQEFYNIRAELKKNKDPRELGYKIVINSIYGISSVPIFMNVWNPTVAKDTTGIGQQITKYAIKRFNEEEFEVIAADTDSCFVKLNNKSRDECLRLAITITEKVKSHMPFPAESFKLKIDDEIFKIWFPGKKKKHYAYLTKSGKFKVKGLGFVKSDASLLGQKMYDYLTPIVEKRQDALFDKEELEEVAMGFVREDITLVGQMYKVKDLKNYKSLTSIQAQIAKAHGPGDFLMVPNTHFGEVGKSKKYLLVAKYENGRLTKFDDNIAKLNFHDIKLDKFWKEMRVFTKDYISPETKRQMERAEELYQRQRAQMQLSFFESDLFDSEAVGDDISDEEFVENEKHFARFE
jgi:DNA polymerase elongation subunit (family B)